MEEIARVTSTDEGIVRVIIGDEALCEKCSMNILCERRGSIKKEITVIDPIGVKKGDIVKIKLNPYRYILSAYLLFINPIILMLLFYFIGVRLNLSESGSVGLAFIGLTLNFIFLFTVKIRIDKYFKPSIVDWVS